MDPSGVACTNCGKNMTTDDLRRTACVHCGQVLAHHARAAQQVAVVNQMFAQGLPQQMLAQQYNPYAQQGAPGMVGAPPIAPFGGPQASMAQAHAMNQVGAHMQKAAMSVAVIAVVAAILAVVLTCVGIGVAFALSR